MAILREEIVPSLGSLRRFAMPIEMEGRENERDVESHFSVHRRGSLNGS